MISLALSQCGRYLLVDNNNCYQGTKPTSEISTVKKTSDRKALVFLFVIVVALLLGIVGACIAFSLEISKLKSDVALVDLEVGSITTECTS